MCKEYFQSKHSGILNIKCSCNNVESSSVQIDDIQVYDEAVTGHKSSVWTYDNNVNEEVSSSGTKITPTTSNTYYYLANTLITGDFEITYTVPSASSYTHMVLQDSNHTDVFNFIFHKEMGDIICGIGYNTFSHITYITLNTPFNVTIKKEGTTYYLYINDTVVYQATHTAFDCYFAFRGDGANSRYTQFKDFKIKSL